MDSSVVCVCSLGIIGDAETAADRFREAPSRPARLRVVAAIRVTPAPSIPIWRPSSPSPIPAPVPKVNSSLRILVMNQTSSPSHAELYMITRNDKKHTYTILIVCSP